MNANRMIDMIVRQVMRRLVNKGVDKGFEVASRMGGKPDQQDDTGERKQNSGPRPSQNLRQAQKMTRQMRRFMRF
jgi:phosphosulfolactate synthase (CoM biosynthesis protein A)